MRKFLWMIAAVLFTVSMTSCKSCKDSKPEEAEVATKLIVENVTNLNRQAMFTEYGADYKWFECCVLLQDYLDGECDGTVAGISNVFQVVNEKEQGADVHVILYATTPDASTVEVKEGFWVEDWPLNDEQLKVTFDQAFEKVMAVNMPKPHSRQVVLRKQVGPVPANPQWIFGNMQAQIYVDAVTGEVSDKNPSFPDGLKLPFAE